MTLEINRLFVTQHQLRYIDQIPQMVEFVKQRGIWNMPSLIEHAHLYHPVRVSPLMQISRFPDGQCFIHDGHHRLVTTWIGGRKVIFQEEYKITNWTYEEYIEVNIAAGWFTPFDPITRCRKPEFKAKIRSLIGKLDHAKIVEQIRLCEDEYSEPRRFRTVAEMAKDLCLME